MVPILVLRWNTAKVFQKEMGFASGRLHLGLDMHGGDEWCDRPSPLPQNSTDTCLPTQDPLRPAWSMQSWFIGPRRSLSPTFLCLSLWHTLSYTQRILILTEEGRREMAPVISPLLTGTLQRSLSQSPRGADIKQRNKPFTFYCLLPQRAHISFLILSIFFFYRLLTYSCHLSSLSHYGLPLSLRFIKSDILTTLFKYQHKRNTQRWKQKQRSKVHRAGDIFKGVRDKLPPQISRLSCAKHHLIC